MYKKIYLDAPNIGKLEKRYLNRAIDSGYISSVGPSVSVFEKKCSDYLKSRKAVLTNSGTSAIHIALYELGIGKGDEVIIPALTFIATANPVLYVGATPVLVDVNRQTWNIDPQAIEEAITEQTKAVIPVHLYGNPCDMDQINHIAKKYDLLVIEDAAESLGAKYRGKYTGTLGDLGCISFNGNKTITTGGGGLVVGDDVQRLDHIKFLVNQGRDNPGEIYHSEIGFNYRMSNIGASMGLAQFSRLGDFLTKKKTFNRIYKEELRQIKNIRFQEEHEGAESSFWFTCVISEDDTPIRDLQKKLSDKGVPTRRVFTPINDFPPYRNFRFVDYGNAHHIHERGLCLPSSTLNETEDIREVCSTLKDCYLESCLVP